MNCYFHPQAESVVMCGKCGVAMCRECETNAFLRLDGGKGQALCNRCSLNEAQAAVDYEASWLRKRLVKLIFCSIFVGIGAFILWVTKDSGDFFGVGIFFTSIFWAISGAIANIGNKTENDSIKNQVWNAAFEYDHPFISLIIGIAVNAFLGPVLLIIHFIGYARTKFLYKKDLRALENIKAAVNL